MSYWTYMLASIVVDTHIESDNIKADVEKMLTKAPLITGSESPAHLFVNVVPGYNINTVNGHNYQSRVIITVIGDLRDRMKKQTLKEWTNFKLFLTRDLNFSIENSSCRIKGCPYAK